LEMKWLIYHGKLNYKKTATLSTTEAEYG